MIVTFIVTVVIIAALYKWGDLCSALKFVGYYGTLLFLMFLCAALVAKGHFLLTGQLLLVAGTAQYAWLKAADERDRKEEQRQRNVYMEQKRHEKDN